MIRVTADLFSGRPNPSWIINDISGDEILRKITADQGIISTPKVIGYEGLGFRGIKIELMNDDERFGQLPEAFTIANGIAEDQKTSMLLAKEIIDQMLKYEKNSMEVHNITPINREIQKIIFESIEGYERNIDKIRKHIKIQEKIAFRNSVRVTVKDDKCTDCKYEQSKFNPGFWNNDSYVKANNNCYNYGRNWKTNTFAQPGRFSGMTAASMSCADVKIAAMNDGLVERCKCLPQSEYPRRLVALVIAPGQDYHWYRRQKNGFWGHKPGSTDARNYDNSGVLITNPETCDRGVGTSLNYTNFCGYFYAGKSVMIS
jgi:hypothetical protein